MVAKGQESQQVRSVQRQEAVNSIHEKSSSERQEVEKCFIFGRNTYRPWSWLVTVSSKDRLLDGAVRRSSSEHWI